MQILILASTPELGERIRANLDGTTDRCSVVTAWSDVLSSIAKRNRPDVILVERAALAHLELSSLLSLTQTGPPPLLVDASVAGVEAGITVANRLGEDTPPYYQIGQLRIDTRRKRAVIGDRWVLLPPTQYRLLLALAKRAGEVIGSQELLRTVWGDMRQERSKHRSWLRSTSGRSGAAWG